MLLRKASVRALNSSALRYCPYGRRSRTHAVAHWGFSARTRPYSPNAAELFVESGLPAGVFNVVNGDKEAMDAILADGDINAVGFVGSSSIAQYFYAGAAATRKRAQCFGGAKNHATRPRACHAESKHADNSVTVEVGCGLLVVAGYRTRVAAAVLALLFCLLRRSSFIRTLPIPTRRSTSSRTCSWPAACFRSSLTKQAWSALTTDIPRKVHGLARGRLSASRRAIRDRELSTAIARHQIRGRFLGKKWDVRRTWRNRSEWHQRISVLCGWRMAHG
jgi:uncharacterized membrane protein YphA (DoxX/SURF4 family)